MAQGRDGGSDGDRGTGGRARRASSGAARRGRPGGATDATERNRGAGRRRDHAVAGSDARGPRRGTGRQRPNYALRRLSALAIALIVLAAVGAVIVLGSLWVRDLVRTQDQAQAASEVTTLYPEPTACTGSELETSLSVPSSVSVDQPVAINATITNHGSRPCVVDGGSLALTAVVTSGDTQVWTSTQCTVTPTSRPLLIDAGATSETTLTWDGRVNRTVCPTPTATATDLFGDPVTTSTPTDGATASATDQATPAATDSATATPSDAASAAPSTSAAPSADPSATTSADPGSGEAAGAGTYQVHLELGGRSVTDSSTFTIG